MPSLDLHKLVERIHQRGCPLVVAVTGGGSGTISDLLRVPGASRTVLEAIVPYSAEALTGWLGARPEQFCSSRTARAMAMVAYRRALELTRQRHPRPQVLGLGCTASLASDRPKRGPHRAHFAWQSRTATVAGELNLHKGHRSREAEETLLAQLLLLTIDDATASWDAVSPNLPEPASTASLFASYLELLEDEQLTFVRQDAPQPWQALLSGELNVVGERAASGQTPGSQPRTIFPGAFNPRHHGHNAMAEFAARRLGRSVEFELSTANVDKPPLDYLEMASRLQHFLPSDALWFTRAPTFVEKSRIFPGSTFVVGADTIVRIGQPRYYAGASLATQTETCEQAIAEIAAQGCRFLVFGRRRGADFESLESIEIPATLRSLCDGVHETEFRADVSSTELRQQASESEST